MIDNSKDGTRLIDLVQDGYTQLQSNGHVVLDNVTFTFQPLPMRTGMDWDTLNKGSSLLPGTEQCLRF